MLMLLNSVRVVGNPHSANYTFIYANLVEMSTPNVYNEKLW